MGDNEVDIITVVPKGGSAEQPVIMGVLAAAEVNPLKTEVPSE